MWLNPWQGLVHKTALEMVFFVKHYQKWHESKRYSCSTEALCHLRTLEYLYCVYVDMWDSLYVTYCHWKSDTVNRWVNMDYFLIQLFCQWILRCLVFIPFYCCLAKWQCFVCEAGFALLSIPGGTLHCVASLYHRWHATICVWGKRTREREYTPSRRPESTPYRLSWLGVQRCCPDTIIHHTYLHANTHSHMDTYYAHAPVEGNVYHIQWGL